MQDPDESVYNLNFVFFPMRGSGEVKILNPGERAPDGDKFGITYIECDTLIYPQEHEALGRCIASWSRLEVILRQLFGKLLGVDEPKIAALAMTLSGKGLIDAIDRLAVNAIAETLYTDLKNLNERLSSLNTKRNYIVHGYWSVEIKIFENRAGEVEFRRSIVREYPPASEALNKALADPKNQKLRNRHLYDLRSMSAFVKTSNALRRDYEKLLQAL